MITTVTEEGEEAVVGTSAKEGNENDQMENECNSASDTDDHEYSEDELDLYCPACKKSFKTVKA